MKLAPRKSGEEAKVERVTWFLMVLVFALLYFLDPDAQNRLPNGLVPLSGAIILLGSGIYQFSRRWHVSPVTWIGGTILLLLAMVNFTVDPEMNFYGFTLLTFAAVIGLGVLTGET